MSNLLRFNYEVNPALFSIVLTNAGYLSFNFKQNFHFCGITDNLNFTWISLAYFYPQAEFMVLLTDQKKISDKEREILNRLKISNLKVESLKENKLSSKKFNFIALDISYSLLYSHERKKVMEILKNQLKDNGIFYLEYESLPGRESKQNFFNFIRLMLKKWNLNEVYEFLNVLLIRPTAYLIKHNDLRIYINNLLNKRDDRAVLREILNGDYRVFFFEEIYKQFVNLELTFSGRADLELNDPEIGVFPAHVPTILRFSKNLDKRESLVDFILNISIHRDIFVKKPFEDFEKALDFICENFYLLPRQKPENLRRIISLPGGHRYPLTAEVYDYFFAPSEEPRNLCKHPMFKGNKTAVWKAFYKVLSTGEFFLCVTDEVQPLETTSYELPEEFVLSPLNEEILKEGVSNLSEVYLTSEPTKGFAIYLNPLETVLLWFAFREGKSKAIEKTYEYLQSIDKRINMGGELRDTKEISEEDIEKIARNLFTGRKTFNLKRLRIIKF